jgi:hypothetical protein
MFFPLAMLYGIYFTFLPRQLLRYVLEEKQYNIFPPGPVTVLRCMKMMIFTLGLNVRSSACKFNDFVMNNPDIALSTISFFPVYFYQVPSSLFP